MIATDVEKMEKERQKEQRAKRQSESRGLDDFDICSSNMNKNEREESREHLILLFVFRRSPSPSTKQTIPHAFTHNTLQTCGISHELRHCHLPGFRTQILIQDTQSYIQKMEKDRQWI